MEADELTCLIAADPSEPETERELPDVAYAKAFGAWAAARDAALEDWLKLTDPNELKPTPPKAMRDAAELVYLHGQGVLTPADQNDLLSRLNSAPPNRVVKDVRAVLRSDDSPAAKIEAIRSLVVEAGLTPAVGIDPMPYLEPADVHLIAWMAVQGKDSL